ncbi:DUF6230 family protein [Antrihabitans cavernicola]|uniref:Cholesterol esterase n=1 Tax=Antrihabitans cavernicola TaxID=2495913 RepID=A0A5A7SE27_9NOCA|nr:DUF6230 family protein [Spelaeibacter cavernicola]KAA0023824.1 hypothetical protein FOY51_04290 [Spelaeibacter cavernicola]
MNNPIRRSASRLARTAVNLAQRGREQGTHAAQAWNAQMLVSAETRHGTRWGRGVAILVPTVIATGFVAAGIGQGVLATSFNVSNQPFEIHATELTGNGLGAVIGASNVKNDDGSVAPTAVVHAGLNSADISGLCLIAKQNFMGAGYSILVSSAGDQKAGGQNVMFDVTDLDAMPALLSKAVLGRSADEINAAGQNLGGQAGGFGLDVTDGVVTLNNINATAYNAQVVGQLAIPHLKISLKPGTATGC